MALNTSRTDCFTTDPLYNVIIILSFRDISSHVGGGLNGRKVCHGHAVFISVFSIIQQRSQPVDKGQGHFMVVKDPPLLVKTSQISAGYYNHGLG